MYEQKGPGGRYDSIHLLEMVVEVNIPDLATPEYAMDVRAEFVVEIRIWVQELITLYQYEVIETVDYQVPVWDYSSCKLFLWYRNHPTYVKYSGDSPSRV